MAARSRRAKHGCGIVVFISPILARGLFMPRSSFGYHAASAEYPREEMKMARSVAVLSIVANVALVVTSGCLYLRCRRIAEPLLQNEALCLMLSQHSDPAQIPNLRSIAHASGEWQSLEAGGLLIDTDGATNRLGDRFDLARRLKDGKILVVPSGPTFGMY